MMTDLGDDFGAAWSTAAGDDLAGGFVGDVVEGIPGDGAEDVAGDVDDGDGRHRRRGRNREAVVDAMLSLFREGNVQPSAAEIAERAGLSQRSLFRYFSDLEDLGRLAISRQLQLVVPLVPIDAVVDAPLPDRIRALAMQRVALYDEAAPAARVTRLRAPLHPLVRAQLERGRQFLRRQAADLLAPELAEFEPDDAHALLDVIDVLTSFEVHQLFRGPHGRSSAETVDLLSSAISAQFAAAGR